MPFEKRRRAAALQDADAMFCGPNVREASWSAPVLWRFARRPISARLTLNCSAPISIEPLYDRHVHPPFTRFIEKTLSSPNLSCANCATIHGTRHPRPPAALWLLIFGQVFARSGAMHTGNIPYLDFIAPGILAQSVLFVAIFYGINVIWERDLGIVQKFLASPTPRSALVLGKGFSAGFRTLSQAAIVYMLSLLLG